MTIALLVWLLDTTIKGSVMIVLVAALQRAVGSRVDARWRHLLWVIVLLRLVIPDTPSSRWSMFNLLPAKEPVVIATSEHFASPVSVVAARGAEDRQIVTLAAPRLIGIARWVVAIWLMGVLLLALRTLIGSIRMHRAVRRAMRAGSTAGPLRTVECDFVKTPALHGLFRPVLLLPRGFNEAFNAEELRHVMLHELWHVRRLDVAVSWLLAVAQAIHWFNPLVWFAGSRIKEERELSCDELALSLLEEEERTGYGRTILKLLERFRIAAPVPALVGIVNDKQKMKRRLMMIASFRNRTRFTVLFLLLAAAVGTAGLTDAEGGKRRFTKKLDPAAIATMERMHERVSFEMSNGTLNDLISTVSNKAGVVVTQAPELATSPVQNARFTIKAENVPAHAVLMEALMPFELFARPDAAGVTIATGGPDHKIILAPHPGHLEEDVIITHGTPTHAFKVRKHQDGHEAPDGVHKRVFIRKLEKNPATFDENGRLRRELTLEFDENGVESAGKLTIEIMK